MLIFSGSGTATAPPPDFMLEADLGLGLSDNDPVATWADQSGNGNTATQGTAGNKPTFKATAGPGGLPCVEFDSNDFLSLASGISSSNYTIFAVMKRGGSGDRTLLSGISGSYQYRTSGNNQYSLLACTEVIGNGTATLSTTVFQQINVRYTGGTGVPASGVALYRYASAADGTATNANAPTQPINTIGKNNCNGSEFWASPVSSIRLYTRVLTLSEVQAVEAALLAKWGV